MSYKPDEKDWMAYLYGELDGDGRERFEKYLLENESAQAELQKYHSLRHLMSNASDEEVIAPPIFLTGTRSSFWSTPYFRTIVSIAASLLLIIIAGKVADVNLSLSNRGLSLTFGKETGTPETTTEPSKMYTLTEEQVQQMIDRSLASNNNEITSTWRENEAKLTRSIQRNLALNSSKVDALVRDASTASQDQIRQFVASMQEQNMKQVKDYFALTSAEQKTYIENLLVDFADYLQQQRNNDLQLVQMQMNSLEKDTDIFKQETEQILTSIISSVGTTESKEIKN